MCYKDLGLHMDFHENLLVREMGLLNVGTNIMWKN